jgi:uncharacterized protein YcbX
MVAQHSGWSVPDRTPYPQMLQISTGLIPGGLLLSAPGRSPILAMTQVYKESVRIGMERQLHRLAWRCRCGCLAIGLHGHCLPSAMAGHALTVPWRAQTPMSFADGYPYLLVNQASLDTLNQELRKPVTVQHFRPNLVVSGALPYEEDDWKVIQIGDIVFDVAKPCTRCQMITTDPVSAVVDADNEPMRTLSKTRQLVKESALA